MKKLLFTLLAVAVPLSILNAAAEYNVYQDKDTSKTVEIHTSGTVHHDADSRLLQNAKRNAINAKIKKGKITAFSKPSTKKEERISNLNKADATIDSAPDAKTYKGHKFVGKALRNRLAEVLLNNELLGHVVMRNKIKTRLLIGEKGEFHSAVYLFVSDESDADEKRFIVKGEIRKLSPTDVAILNKSVTKKDPQASGSSNTTAPAR